jgi:hypothetical protein
MDAMIVTGSSPRDASSRMLGVCARGCHRRRSARFFREHRRSLRAPPHLFHFCARVGVKPVPFRDRRRPRVKAPWARFMRGRDRRAVHARARSSRDACAGAIVHGVRPRLARRARRSAPAASDPMNRKPRRHFSGDRDAIVRAVRFERKTASPRPRASAAHFRRTATRFAGGAGSKVKERPPSAPSKGPSSLGRRRSKRMTVLGTSTRNVVSVTRSISTSNGSFGRSTSVNLIRLSITFLLGPQVPIASMKGRRCAASRLRLEMARMATGFRPGFNRRANMTTWRRRSRLAIRRRSRLREVDALFPVMTRQSAYRNFPREITDKS